MFYFVIPIHSSISGMGWDGLIPVMIAKLSLERLKPHLNEFTLNQNQIFIEHQKLFLEILNSHLLPPKLLYAWMLEELK